MKAWAAWQLRRWRLAGTCPLHGAYARYWRTLRCTERRPPLLAPAYSQLCFSTDGQRLAVAAESGLVAVHPWAAQAGLLGTQPGAAASTAGPSGLSCMLSSAVTALAWVDGGAGSPEGCGSGGLLAAALLAGGIQLLSVDAAGSGGGGGAGSIAPTAVLRGHSGIIRSLLWLPPRLELVQPAAELQQSAPGAAPAAPAPGQQGLAEGAVASPEGQARGDQSQGEATETAAAAEGVDGPAPLPELRRKLLLLSGGEDASVRLFDVNRQLAAWQQRQQAAAAEAAAPAVAAPAAAPAQVERAGALAGKGEAGLGSAAAAAGTEAPGGSGPPTPTVLVEPQQPDTAEGAIEVPPPPPPASQEQSMSGTCSSPTTGAAVVAAVPQAVAQALPAAAPSAPPEEHMPAAAAAAAAAAPAAQQAVSRAAAGAGPAGGSKKKAVASLLGDRGILQPLRVAEDDPRQQQAAQQACLQLAQQLLAEQTSQAAANEASTVGPPPPPPPPCTPPTALLLDCTVDPLYASLALQQHSEGLAAAATSAPSSASRLALAQRAAAAALLRGDVGAAMRVLLEHDALSADFVSLSAAAGGAGCAGEVGVGAWGLGFGVCVFVCAVVVGGGRWGLGLVRWSWCGAGVGKAGRTAGRGACIGCSAVPCLCPMEWRCRCGEAQTKAWPGPHSRPCPLPRSQARLPGVR